ncbi:unnamed protein product [Lymnaea stagnalis]|uniref:Selenoprotein P N-terminal domain-containing protein n=1 Tax=Lymnaea stagnalis TaxID=6523 RepID=A0AAV2IFZ6_LYMST
MAAGRWAVLGLCLVTLVTDVTSQRRCQVPQWPASLGDNPLASNSGKVVLVALMKGYCSYCVNQATRLEALKNRLASQGFNDIAMIIVNGGEPISRERIANLQQATTSLPVIQDTEQHVMFRDVFAGNKDDFIVYDRCGQRAVFIPHPYSYLSHGITERVLKTVYRGGHSCHCSLDIVNAVNPLDQMLGDQPAGDQPAGEINWAPRYKFDLYCPASAKMCQKFQEKFRKNRLERGRFLSASRHGLRKGHHGHKPHDAKLGKHHPHHNRHDVAGSM